ncbi:hypothetical protein Mycch_1998 [Mycolicibacterium chubuense NBB4]|uniref:Uncharacterized protein n=1 Tax=Mycolicibacterium chubuense (strain NBB4) TaxID=710421 RepID=I4BHM6_MYCCN|nr:hypothetical protein [Mycolicibacterium chubuense]AFM16783.1 hypothetical protein Mycch_1998 [Mycolicibacterium chubuense NBB4]
MTARTLSGSYDLVVIGEDVASVVRAAGGWLCDRARAGWQVTASVPAATDVRALRILGVRAETGDPGAGLLDGLSPAAVSVDARLVSRDEQVRREVLRYLDDARTEVTVWGEPSVFAADRRFDPVHHRLSAAARAFKQQALLAAGGGSAGTSRETFAAASLWYPLDGADLLGPTSGRGGGAQTSCARRRRTPSPRTR